MYHSWRERQKASLRSRSSCWQETWEGGINGKQGDRERFCGKLQDSNPRRERDEIVHQWEQTLKDCKSNSCMWVIRIPRQIKVQL